MEPVTAAGLAGSVAGLADLAFKVFSNLHKYYRDVRSAPAQSEQLRRELDAMLDLITVMQETFEANPNELLRPSLAAEVNDFEAMLQDMMRRTQPRNTQGLQRLRWPFREDENKYYISRIERFKLSFSLVMNITQMYCPYIRLPHRCVNVI